MATNRAKGEGSIYQHTDGRWMYSIMHRGKRLSKSLGTRDEDEARRNLPKIRNNFMGRIDRGELESPTVVNVTLEEVLDEYLKHIDGGKSWSMVNGVLGKVRRSREFSNRKVASLITDDFKAYRKRLVAGGASHSTVNNHFAYIRAALNLETKQTPPRVGKVPHIPIVKVKNIRQGFLEYNDYEVLLDCLPASLRALFVVAFHSGCRMGEVLAMRWRDVDWRNRIIRLPDSKNGKSRNLPFWGGIEKHLKRQKAYCDKHHPECDHLYFWMEKDSRVGHGGLRNLPGSPIQDFRGSWIKAVKEAHKRTPSIKADLLFHDLRRSGVRIMIQECGLPESQAMHISGHESRSMLERYNIVSLRNIQDAGAKLDAWQKSRSKRVTDAQTRNKRAKPA